MELLRILALHSVGALVADYIRIRKQNAKLSRNVTDLSKYVAKHYGLHYTYWLINKEDE